MSLNKSQMITLFLFQRIAEKSFCYEKTIKDLICQCCLSDKKEKKAKWILWQFFPFLKVFFVCLCWIFLLSFKCQIWFGNMATNCQFLQKKPKPFNHTFYITAILFLAQIIGKSKYKIETSYLFLFVSLLC